MRIIFSCKVSKLCKFRCKDLTLFYKIAVPTTGFSYLHIYSHCPRKSIYNSEPFIKKIYNSEPHKTFYEYD